MLLVLGEAEPNDSGLNDRLRPFCSGWLGSTRWAPRNPERRWVQLLHWRWRGQPLRRRSISTIVWSERSPAELCAQQPMVWHRLGPSPVRWPLPPMVPSCSCFARRSKRKFGKYVSHWSDWRRLLCMGLFPRFWPSGSKTPQSVYALRAMPDTLRHHWAWLRHAKPFGEAWWAHKGSNLGPLPC